MEQESHLAFEGILFSQQYIDDFESMSISVDFGLWRISVLLNRTLCLIEPPLTSIRVNFGIWRISVCVESNPLLN